MSADMRSTVVRLQNELDNLRAEYLELVHVVSHDLIGPFRQIDGFATLILENHSEEFDEKTKRQFEFIINGSEQGKNILDALLSYSHLLNAESSFVEVDCRRAIEHALDALAPEIADADADINYATTAVIAGDNKQINLLFYHLIHNALHYQTGKVPPVITIESEQTQYHWKFVIQDNGIGVKDKMAERIFVALKRGVSNKEYSGLGMGLTIAKAIVKRHGGEISLNSNAGEGSSFSFTISKETSFV